MPEAVGAAGQLLTRILGAIGFARDDVYICNVLKCRPPNNRDPQPKRLIHFIRWASDLKTMHRCCTSETRDCSTCKDGAAHMSWVMVNKRAHIRITKDLQNWIEVYEMFAKLYQFIPW